MSLHRIDTVDELHRYLQVALQLEHATIPPYITALYSMYPTTNGDASRILRVVAVEEMLHLTLAANIMNAVGGTPDLTADGFVPAYPTHLPDGETDFEVSLRPFSQDAVRTFLQIERTAARVTEDDGLVERERSPRALLPTVRGGEGAELHFFSIGEFYAEIDRGLHWLHDDLASRGERLFCGDPARQVTPEYYYSGGGEIIVVSDIESASAAIRLISEQGEGLGGAIYDEEGELSHYYRFEQLFLGRYYQPGDDAGAPSGPSFEVDWTAAHPVKVDVRPSDYPEGSELRAAVVACNTSYQQFLRRLTESYNGRPDLLMPAVGDMFQLKELIGQILRSELPGSNGMHAAPIFDTQEW